MLYITIISKLKVCDLVPISVLDLLGKAEQIIIIIRCIVQNDGFHKSWQVPQNETLKCVCMCEIAIPNLYLQIFRHSLHMQSTRYSLSRTAFTSIIVGLLYRKNVLFTFLLECKLNWERESWLGKAEMCCCM